MNSLLLRKMLSSGIVKCPLSFDIVRFWAQKEALHTSEYFDVSSILQSIYYEHTNICTHV